MIRKFFNNHKKNNALQNNNGTGDRFLNMPIDLQEGYNSRADIELFRKNIQSIERATAQALKNETFKSLGKTIPLYLDIDDLTDLTPDDITIQQGKFSISLEGLFLSAYVEGNIQPVKITLCELHASNEDDEE